MAFEDSPIPVYSLDNAIDSFRTEGRGVFRHSDNTMYNITSDDDIKNALSGRVDLLQKPTISGNSGIERKYNEPQNIPQSIENAPLASGVNSPSTNRFRQEASKSLIDAVNQNESRFKVSDNVGNEQVPYDQGQGQGQVQAPVEQVPVAPIVPAAPIQRPLSTDEKLSELVKIAEAGKAVRAATERTDLSGDAFFHDQLRGQYADATGRPTQTPQAAQSPAFKPRLDPEVAAFRDRALQGQESSIAANILQASKGLRQRDKEFDLGMKFKKDSRDINETLQNELLQVRKDQLGANTSATKKGLKLREVALLDNIKRNKSITRQADDRIAQSQQNLNQNEYFRGLDAKRADKRVGQTDRQIDQGDRRLDLAQTASNYRNYFMEEKLSSLKDNQLRNKLVKELDGVKERGGDVVENQMAQLQLYIDDQSITPEEAEKYANVIRSKSGWQKFYDYWFN